MKRLGSSAGFTFIELLIVIAVIGVFAGVLRYAIWHSATKTEGRSLQVAMISGTPLTNADSVYFEDGFCTVEKIDGRGISRTVTFPGDMSWSSNKFFVGSFYRFTDGPDGKIVVEFIDRKPGEAIALIRLGKGCSVALNKCVRKDAYVFK